MTSPVFKKLRKLVDRFGREVVDDPRRCEAYLRDLFPENRRDVFVLLGAVKEQVCKELLESTLPAQSLLHDLTMRLNQNLGIEKDISRWAVCCWAYALQVDYSKHFNCPFKCPFCNASGQVAWRIAGLELRCPNTACNQKLSMTINGEILAIEGGVAVDPKPAATPVNSVLSLQTSLPVARMLPDDHFNRIPTSRSDRNSTNAGWSVLASGLSSLWQVITNQEETRNVASNSEPYRPVLLVPATDHASPDGVSSDNAEFVGNFPDAQDCPDPMILEDDWCEDS